jgi:hypothetical protein
MSNYIVSLLQKTSNDGFMSDKKPELSDAMKKKLEPKKFTKNPILKNKIYYRYFKCKRRSWKINIRNKSSISSKTGWL